MNKPLLIVTAGTYILGYLILWFLSPFLLEAVNRIAFLIFRPFSTLVQADITKEFIVLTKRELSTFEAAPAWEIRYEIDGRTLSHIDANRIMFGQRDITPAEPSPGLMKIIQEKRPDSNLNKFLKSKQDPVLGKDFEKYRILRPPVYFIPNSIPMKAGQNSTLGEIYGTPLARELGQYYAKENGLPRITLRIFKWFPTWPNSPFSNYWSTFNSMGAGIIGIGVTFLYWFFTIKSLLAIHSTNSFLFLAKIFLLFSVTFIALKWPCHMNRQWLDPAKRPRILIDENFSENTRLWERH